MALEITLEIDDSTPGMWDDKDTPRPVAELWNWLADEATRGDVGRLNAFQAAMTQAVVDFMQSRGIVGDFEARTAFAVVSKPNAELMAGYTGACDCADCRGARADGTA